MCTELSRRRAYSICLGRTDAPIRPDSGVQMRRLDAFCACRCAESTCSSEAGDRRGARAGPVEGGVALGERAFEPLVELPVGHRRLLALDGHEDRALGR